jgi:hypothetical protein
VNCVLKDAVHFHPRRILTVDLKRGTLLQTSIRVKRNFELTGPLQGKKTPGQDTAWISTSAFSLSTDNQIILSIL